MNRSEWAAARHSYRLGAAHRLAESKLHPVGRLPVPSWVSKWLSDHIQSSCFLCQEDLDIHYGSAECTVCPLADFVNRLKKGNIP
jgi:hypothetical protein